MNFAVAAILKDEDAYLLEWLAFHKIVGFNSFLIADNGSSDQSGRMLRDLSNRENIHLIDFPDVDGKRPQLDAYEALVHICPPDVDAIAFIDLDEFIVPMGDTRSVCDVLGERFTDPDVSGVVLNWACFGSGNELFWNDGLVIDRFKKRSLNTFSVNQHFKVVVRPQAIGGWLSPHQAALREGRYVDVLGDNLEFRDGTSHSLSKNVVWENIRINHYVVKSFEEFISRKSPKGSASKEGRVKHKRYFELHNKNNEECNLASSFSEEVTAQINRYEKIIEDAQASDGKNEQKMKPLWLNSIRSRFLRD